MRGARCHRASPATSLPTSPPSTGAKPLGSLQASRPLDVLQRRFMTTSTHTSTPLALRRSEAAQRARDLALIRWPRQPR